MDRAVRAVGLVLLLCIGVRVAAWLIEPVLPLLGAMFVIILILGWLLSGPRGGHGRRW
jgi:hypothetical protein